MLKQTLKYKQAVIVKKRSLEASRPAVRSEADLGPVVRGYACRGSECAERGCTRRVWGWWDLHRNLVGFPPKLPELGEEHRWLSRVSSGTPPRYGLGLAGQAQRAHGA